MNFLRRDPTINSIPAPTPAMPKTAGAIAFLDEHETMRQDLAYYQQQCELLSKDVKVANETIRRLETELTYLRDDRDLIYCHDKQITKSLRIIANIINDELVSADRAKPEPSADHPDDQSRLAAVEAALNSHQLEEPQS